MSLPCARCGAFEADGPAAAVGVALCGACLEHRSPDVARRMPALPAVVVPIVLVVLAAALGLVVATTIGLLMLGWLPVEVLMPVTFGVMGALGVAAALLPVWFVFTATRRIGPKLAAALAVDPEALAPAVSGGGLALLAVVLRSPRTWAPMIGAELAFVVLTARGAVVYGPKVRLAAPWAALDIATARLPFRWIRLGERSSGPYVFLTPASPGGLPAPAKALRAEIEALRAAAGEGKP